MLVGVVLVLYCATTQSEEQHESFDSQYGHNAFLGFAPVSKAKNVCPSLLANPSEMMAPTTEKRMVARVWSLLLVVATAAQQRVPIPKGGVDGFRCGAAATNASLQLDLFLDLACDDCKAAWPTLKSLPTAFPGMSFVLHLFPLPYHLFAFELAKSAHVVAVHNRTALWRWVDAVFAAQPKYQPPADDLTRSIVEESLADLAASLRITSRELMRSEIASGAIDEETRIGWKYGCTRSVAATPSFFVNGVLADDANAEWGLKEWHQLLDPLVPSTRDLGVRKPMDACPSP